MLTKLLVFLAGTLCESITKEYLEGICGKNFKKRNEFLVEKGIITVDLQADLDWLWDTRNRMHLFQLDEAEYKNDYDDECHQKSILAFRGLIDALRLHGGFVVG